ncbi:MAG: hypothetical protein J6B68_01875 [Lachnospiraceae bacterium]|nr:hypothetical protein [Lachnospiraceae bacterium]MBP3477596.1 hypothetical protein [Lachnospiraceae bacterium]
MDLLYSRYASPIEFMSTYINQGRFGEFVSEILALDAIRKKDEAKEKNDDRLWDAYVHSMSDKTFVEWKKDLEVNKKPVNYSMTNKEIKEVKQQAADILKKISPV